MDSKSVTEKLIREIVEECARRGEVVPGPLAAFMVKAVALDPRNGFDDHSLSRQDVQKLKELCLEKLTEKCNPALDTIQMQQVFHMNYASRHEFLEEIHQLKEFQLSQMTREITDSRAVTQQELEALYHQIVVYTVLRSDVGSPSDTRTVQEATAALQSIFPKTELVSFLDLLKKDKEERLREIAMIVTGVRFFNKANRGGKKESKASESGSTLKECFQDTIETITDELSVTQSLVWRYTAVLEALTRPDSQSRQTDVPVVLLKQALYNVRQHEAFLKVLQTDAGLCINNVDVLQTKVPAQMKLLRETVQSKPAVPASVLVPLYKAVYQLWRELQDEAALLNVRNIALDLQPFVTPQASMFSKAYLDSLMDGAELKTDEQRMAESCGEQIDPAQMEKQEWLTPETSTDFNDLPLEFNGFCGYTLVKRDGLLLPGNPRIGVLKHKEKFFVFSSKEAALEFASSPDDFIADVTEKSRCFPERVQLLKLHQQLLGPISEVLLKLQPVEKCDKGTQTDIHPIETNVDRSYEWNEWNLRRKALKLADLQTKATHSTQTNLKHMRQDVVTQTWLPKDAACQSSNVHGSNVPRPQIYLAGLKGSKAKAPGTKVDLTRPVGKE